MVIFVILFWVKIILTKFVEIDSIEFKSTLYSEDELLIETALSPIMPITIFSLTEVIVLVEEKILVIEVSFTWDSSDVYPVIDDSTSNTTALITSVPL